MDVLGMSVELGREGKDIELIVGFDQLECFDSVLVKPGQRLEKYRLNAAESMALNEAVQLGRKINLSAHDLQINGSQGLIRNKHWKCGNFEEVRGRLIEIYGPIEVEPAQKFSQKRHKPDAETSRRSVKCRNRLAVAR